MSLRLSGRNPLSYVGVEPLQPPELVYVRRDPISGPVANADFRNFNVGTFWLNPVNQTLWILVRKPDSNPLWIQLGITAAGFLQTLTPDVGGAVPPTLLNINLFGDANITTRGTPGSSLINVTLNPSITVTNLTVTNNSILNNLTVNGTLTIPALGQGVVQSNAGGMLFSSEGANGQVLISGGPGFQPVWANITSGDGSVTITNGAGTIDLSTTGAGGGTVKSLTGNDLVAVGPDGTGTIFLKTDHATVKFLSGIANQETLDFLDAITGNLVLGSSLPTLAGGTLNTGLGSEVLNSLINGNRNTAVGDLALNTVTSGSDNTAVGYQAGADFATGSGNTLIGSQAGVNYTTNESNNICISNAGSITDSGAIRIGTFGVHTSAFVQGITAVIPGSNLVTVAANGQLGISAGGGPLNTLTGNIGAAATPLGGNINIKTQNTTIKFDSTPVAHQLTQDFALSNLLMGSNGLIAAASNNAGYGLNALNVLTNGTDNTSMGAFSLSSLTNGSRNTAVGFDALSTISTQNDNTAVGNNALKATTGSNNTALGSGSLANVVSGFNNIAIGKDAASAFVGAEANNIILGNSGIAADGSTIRIGTTGTQTKAFMAGVAGVVVANTNMVTINTVTGQLGSQAIPSGGGGIMIVTQFDFTGAPQTWTKDPATRQVLLLIWNGGNGGGSGRQGTDGGPVGGGGGASGGGCLFWYGPAAGWAASETVIVGAGAPGGVPQLAANSDGNDGGVGGPSSVGRLTPVPALGSFGGKGVAGSSLTVISVGATIQSFGISATTTGSVSGVGTIGSGTAGQGRTTNGNDAFFPSPGGGGGGARTAATPTSGGAGGNQTEADSTVVYFGGAGGVEGGTIDGANGANATFTSGGFYFGGAGGGGGGGQHLGPVAGNGGNGGVPGGGGGGGGASLNGTPSGAGGAGGNGRVIIIEFT